MKRVIVHIDSLVLKGFHHEDRHAIAEGLQRELAQLFADPQATRQLMAVGNRSRMRVSSIQIDPGSRPQGVGTEVARGIGKEIKP
ncbi:hypothetical protein QU481_15545 [Crenobacter sp. SG2303]|uniref:Uncharacterized protein n=1 Tax=Crenobacter oryzisoli TaxID=3056844 RepID=A0ABT7XRV7_9NEIS|nr:hypothetical protein [Crenobacter sp. SG2303]MDN0075093.1 hypothetical protein [Crenobacter sp. SG2303]MDN0076299.1 hypothetical protein [Crenobacter sp. SG2303]